MAVKTTIRTPMPIRMRAKQFAMFDALKGLTEAIAEKERQCVPRKELSEERIEEINRKLKAISKGNFVTVVYYCQYSKQYRELSGKVTGIDNYWKLVQIETVSISYGELFDIIENE